MKLNDAERARWADGMRQRPSADGCPGDETIWSAIAGELGETETRSVVDHLSRCGPCSTSWQLAREMFDELPEGRGREVEAESASSSAEISPVELPSSQTTAGRRGINPWIPRAMAIAATLLLAFVAYPVVREMLVRPPLDPAFRTIDGSALTAVDPETVPLPREACLLRWQGSPEGSLYSVTVSDATGKLSWTVRGIEDTELLVPAERPRGTRIGSATAMAG